MKPQPRYNPGDRIGGRYQVHKALMGGMGEVYLCLDLETNYPYALKTFQQRYLHNPELRSAFKHEVMRWIALGKHINIVHCYMMEIVDHREFMFLEWIASEEGRDVDLRSWLQYGQLNLQKTLNFITDICQGLIHADKIQPGIVHRDLKPENILVASGSLAKVTDFGLAIITQQARMEMQDEESPTSRRHNLVHLNGIVGTPAYMSPEQWQGMELDARADIYAIGCILYEMLSGRQPFIGSTWHNLRNQHLNAKIPQLATEYYLSDTLNQLLERCLAKERAMRFTTVIELLNELAFIYCNEFGTQPRVATNDDLTAESYHNIANTYRNLAQFEEALISHNYAIRLKPDCAAFYSDRALTLAELGRYDEAIADHNDAITLDQTDASAYLNRGSLYYKVERYQEAIVDFNQAAQFEPSLSKVYLNRGTVYATLQQYDQALEDINKAIELDYNYDKAYTNRANIYKELKRYQMALIDYNQAIQLNPEPLSYCNRAEMYRLLGEIEKAVDDYTQAIQFDCNNAQIYYLRGKLYTELHKYNEAIDDYTYALHLGLFEPVYFERGIVYSLQKLYSNALADLDLAIQLKPNSPMAYLQRGVIYSELQQNNLALSDLEQALQFSPNLYEAYLVRGTINDKLKKYEDALRDFNYVVQHNPTAQVYFCRGSTYDNQQQYEKALEDYTYAIHLDNNNGEIYYNRALIHNKLQEYGKALLDYTEAIRINPNYLKAYENRGILFKELQRYDEALHDITKAIQLAPTRSKSYYNRGVICFAMQHYQEAVIDYTEAVRLDPTDSEAYDNRGVIFAMHRQYQEALADFERAIELNTNFALAHFNIGLVLGEVGLWHEAAHYMNQAVQLGHLQATQFALYARQMSDEGQKLQADPAQLALASFRVAGSFSVMQQVAARLPLLLDNDFIAIIENAIEQQVPLQDQPGFKQRLSWLRLIAHEQNTRSPQ